MRTYDEWMTIFDEFTLKYLVEQRGVARDNVRNPAVGPDWGLALEDTIRLRIQAGEFVRHDAPIRIVAKEEEMGRVEMVKCGGKGQLMRVVHPVCKEPIEECVSYS